MTLDDLYAKIIGTEPDDWNVVHAPLFDITAGNWTSGDGTSGVEVDSHYLQGVLETDIDIRIAYGHPTSTTDVDWRPEWAKFADSAVAIRYVDLFYRGALVDRDEVVVVDGGRAVLPAPDNAIVDSPDGSSDFGFEVIGETVSARRVELARVVHHFEHTQPDVFDDYLRRTGFVVVGGDLGPDRDTPSSDSTG